MRRGAALLILIGVIAGSPIVPSDALPASPWAAPASDEGLNDLGSLDELKDRFNRDKGDIRLVLLLSPT